MPKRKDPAVAVIRYFETADLGQAQLVLSLAKDAIARRKPVREQSAGEPNGVNVRRSRRSTVGTPRVPVVPAPLPGA